MSKYASIVLRTGIAIVFLWFGFSQINNPAQWTGMVPGYASIIPLSTITLIYFNGVFEIVFATLLLLGIYTRLTALLLAIHLFHIVTIVGYGAIGARDFALALATLSIFLNGPDEFCLDSINKKNKQDRVQPKSQENGNTNKEK